MIKLYISFLLLVYCSAVSFSVAKRCACSEFDSTVCQAINYCSYVNNTCQALQCSSLTKEKCDASSSEYKCIWNTTASKCEDHNFQCSDLSTEDQCSANLFSKNCDWQNSKCVAFGECKSSTENTCNYLKCSYSKTDGCADSYTGITCSGTDDTSCAKSNGNGNLCALDDNKQCNQINLFPQSCADYQNFSKLCDDHSCRYDTTAKKCVAKTCADITEQSKCLMVVNIVGFTITPCIWKTSCQEASEQEIKDMGMLCMVYTIMNYKWDTASDKCQSCTTLVDNPAFSYMKQKQDEYNSNSSTSIQLSISLVLIINLFLS